MSNIASPSRFDSTFDSTNLACHVYANTKDGFTVMDRGHVDVQVTEVGISHIS